MLILHRRQKRRELLDNPTVPKTGSRQNVAYTECEEQRRYLYNYIGLAHRLINGIDF